VTARQFRCFHESLAGIENREAPAGFVHGGEEVVSHTGDQSEPRRELKRVHSEAADDVLIDIRAAGTHPRNVREAGARGGKAGNQINERRDSAVRGEGVSQLSSVK